uniref:collagen alpha-1(I) chain-like n=1 Tax=Agelaius phoeniceus TaxID=39638 RepID=UPI0023ECFD34|nr:collagen alpha-1(I) chain-like [Agelaius phoeniceus]
MVPGSPHTAGLSAGTRRSPGTEAAPGPAPSRVALRPGPVMPSATAAPMALPGPQGVPAGTCGAISGTGARAARAEAPAEPGGAQGLRRGTGQRGREGSLQQVGPGGL